MKIPREITVVCRNVTIFRPPFEVVLMPDSISFGVVGARGTWNPELKLFEVPLILNRYEGWRNVYTSVDDDSLMVGFKMLPSTTRLDAVFGENFEETIMNLQLAGKKNVFEIPKKVLSTIEEKVPFVSSPVRSIAPKVTLTFKDLKTKLMRLI